MLCVPTAKLLVLHAAVLLLPLPPSETAEQPLNVVPSLANATVPVGEEPVTVAVNVTLAPDSAGLPEVARVVVELVRLGSAAFTAAAASTIPAPQRAVVQSRPVPVGNARADDCIFASSCKGVSEEFTDSISDATPLT